MKHIKKSFAYLLCLMVSVTMMPVFAFANEQEPAGATEPSSLQADEQAPTVADSQSPEATEEQNSDAEVQEASPEVSAKGGRLEDGKFFDNGAPYVMGDTSGLSNQMKIYAIYMHRNNGSWKSSDRYGDAVLIESNGKYLLMDTGTNTPINKSTEVHTSSLVSTLKSIGVHKLDIYISHMHGDHTGGLKSICEDDYFDVEHVFFPDIETCQFYKTPTTKDTIDSIYLNKTTVAKNAGAQVVYLTPSFRTPRATYTTNKFNVGAAVCTVLGPTGNYKPSDPIFVRQDNDCGTKEGHCLNNCSLTTVIQCGGFRFLTCGDAEAIEEKGLVNKYGKGLDCNILKISHHGLRTSNSMSFVGKVSPMWSFAENHGYSSSSTSSSFRAGNSYGFVFGTASNTRNLIVDVQNNAVRIYKDGNNNGIIDEGPITGWIKCGSGYQHYDGAGYIHTGWNWLSGHAYYMSGSSGFRYTGSHKINGVKVKFSSYGKLTSHSKPAKVRNKSFKAYAGQAIRIKWRKASRASAYQVYRATSKKGTYSCLGKFSKKSRSYTDRTLVKGQRYYYKVRAIRYVAGATLYGSFSTAKSTRSK